METLEQLKAYLAEFTGRIEEAQARGYADQANVESLCAQMWKKFTPHALTLWTTSGVLEHLAECLAPPAESEKDEDDDDEEIEF